jgi:hypothetical protein
MVQCETGARSSAQRNKDGVVKLRERPKQEKRGRDILSAHAAIHLHGGDDISSFCARSSKHSLSIV